jgi:cytoskeleton protein RodZ
MPAGAPTQGARGDTPGARVRAARERARMSPAELSAATKLSVDTIAALEADDYEHLLEPVYVRGYYRKCARVLGLPEEELLALYSARAKPTQPDMPQRVHFSGSEIGRPRRGGRGTAIWAPALAIAICVGLWFMYGQQGGLPSSLVGSNEGSPADGVEIVSKPAITGSGDAPAGPAQGGSDAGAAGAPQALQPAPGTATPPEGGAAGAQGGEAQTPPAPPPAASSSAAISTASGDKQLVLDFTATSWVKVTDSAGRTLLNRVVEAGNRQVLAGTPPYSVFLGNGPGVRVEYAGSNVDFARLVKPNATARFTVPMR